MFSDIVALELRSMRSYAQLMTGSADEGDLIVCEILSKFISVATPDNIDSLDRIHLFRQLDEKLRNSQLQKTAINTVHPLLLDLSNDERRILLLSVLGGFESQELAQITGMRFADIGHVRDRVECIVSAATRTGVLIIEDEPHMAELLSLLVEQTGHWVAGIAHTREQALRLAQRESFGLILSDLELNQASCDRRCTWDQMCLAHRFP